MITERFYTNVMELDVRFNFVVDSSVSFVGSIRMCLKFWQAISNLKSLVYNIQISISISLRFSNTSKFIFVRLNVLR